jgi:hypothetical protein
MTTFLLIAILIMTGWIMITLNEIDRTNHSLIHDTNLNQGKIMQNQQLILDAIKELSLDGQLANGTTERIFEQMLDLEVKLGEIKLKL